MGFYQCSLGRKLNPAQVVQEMIRKGCLQRHGRVKEAIRKVRPQKTAAT